MSIDHLTIDALDEVYKIEDSVHTYPWSKDALASSFGNNEILGLFEQNQLIGFTILLDTTEFIELLDLAIACPYQGQGYGQILLNTVIKLAKNKQRSRILLEVRASNQKAQRLYQKTGFIEIFKRTAYYPAGKKREDALIMEYCL